MADHHARAGSGPGQRHLDASGAREVVYCHRCEHEWYQDQHGLVCPNCEGEITEIVSASLNDPAELLLTGLQVTADSDPRSMDDVPDIPQPLRDLRNHNPWDSDSDPEEADIEEHITHGPGGSVFISQTIRSSNTRHPFGGRRRRAQGGFDNEDEVMRNFQTMLGSLMGPAIRAGPPGRSGPDTLFQSGPFGMGLRDQQGLGAGPGPTVIGGRFSYTGRLRPRDADGPQPGGPPVPDDIATYASPPNRMMPNGRSLYVINIRARPDQVASVLGNLFGQLGAPPGHEGPEARGGMPPSLQGLFASLLNPANAVHGDAVYSQEALDRIMSQLMEQHPTSNAPGPATAEAIAALPKKKIDDKMLGPEGKAECSVCMDDVKKGDEVVVLPCSHWFHEACAGMWLGEHNTCPICRKGIGQESTTPPANPRRNSSTPPSARSDHRARRMSMPRRSSRNEARLDSIRDIGGRRLSITDEGAASATRRNLSDTNVASEQRDYETSEMPGSFFRRRDSEISDNTRDSRRGQNSDSDRASRRSSRSENGGGSGNGPMAWLRDRWGANRRHD